MFTKHKFKLEIFVTVCWHYHKLYIWVFSTILLIDHSKETIIWRLWVQSWLQTSDITGILNTCTWLWLKGIRTGDPCGFNKGCSSKFHESSQEEGWRTYQPKHCGNNNKDKDNSPKTLNDKNQQALSQKFRQLSFPIVVEIFFQLKRQHECRNLQYLVLYQISFWNICQKSNFLFEQYFLIKLRGITIPVKRTRP